MKARIIEHLGESEIILPALVMEGLAANDRAKVRMSALQAAVRHAHNPAAESIDLTTESRAAGIDAGSIRALVVGAHALGGGIIAAPAVAKVTGDLFADVDTMLRAAVAADPVVGSAAKERLEEVTSQTTITSDEIDERDVARLTAVPSNGEDSLHRIVMDLHKVLNVAAAKCAEEEIEGAHVYGLAPEDRPMVTAFMRGLARTRALKFDHPGLETTATRSGPRLVIQNDIGATDAHVLVVAVENLAVTVTYTDVHDNRAGFFVRLFDAFPVQWSGLERERAEGLGDHGEFSLITGRFAAETPERCNDFLEAIGSSIVFVIDWNKGRKALRTLCSNADAMSILDWAARQRIGHRAFLELGGPELVASAIRHAASSRIGFGERLETAFGRSGAIDFLKTVLRLSTEALLSGRSVRLVRDAIEADLVRRLERTDSMLLAIVVRQAGLAREIIAAIADHLASDRADAAGAAALAARARHIEEKADVITLAARGEVARFNAGHTIEQLVNRVEQAIDEFEQAAFIASLLKPGIDAALRRLLTDLSAAAIAGAEATAAGAAAAATVPEGRRIDVDDALDAVGRLIALEHAADAAERAVTTMILTDPTDLTDDCNLKTSISALELARAIERAMDELAGCGHLLRQHVLTHLAQ